MIFKSEHEYNPENPYQFFYAIDEIERAAILFRVAHDSIKHKRKYSGLPYWTHTERVAELVLSVTDTETDMGKSMVIAALGHDLLEDVAPVNPEYSLEWLVRHFSHDVASMIFQLTDVFTKQDYPHLNRAQRKQLENERLGQIWPEAQTIKLADLADNTEDILSNDKNFAKVYLREKDLLIPLLSGGNKKMWDMAKNSVDTLLVMD
jgi:(p)ppGpp synthase/HD superfamily hydrolase